MYLTGQIGANSKWNSNIKVKNKTIQVPERTMGEFLFNISVEKGFLIMIPKKTQI